MASRRSFAALWLALVACSCQRPPVPTAAKEPALFERLAPSATGVTFENTLPESTDFNILNYLYYYNGGGVAVGDVDGNGYPDLYFSSNLGPNRLYLNKGGYVFEDATEAAGVKGPEGWKTGVAMADVDGDGDLDLFLCAVSYLTMHGRNVLYINDGHGHFVDRTQEFGLEFAGYSTQALFFDYDRDGDLDMYLLNHSTHIERGIEPALRNTRASPSADRLYRNDHSRFVDVSVSAGIADGVGGFGLGVVASDFNGDGCPDVYVANDFQENDFLYVNQCDGTFKESVTGAMSHTSRFSMGVDAADMNNDGLPDVVVADMLPEREAIFKTSASYEGANLFDARLRAGYMPQYPRNTLQLNRGDGRFSEIGYLSGVHATDWSWAPLFADLDDDGRKDLFVSSGIYRRPNDLDYINYVGNEQVQATLGTTITEANLALLKRMPQIALASHAFRNDGDLHFTDMAAAWGLGEVGYANGAAYADLNNSGSLDLIVNMINAPAAIYRNRGRTRTGNNSLTLQLRGAGGNSSGIGARVMVVAGGTRQWYEQLLTRGFQSSVDPRLHIGLGRSPSVDSLVVVWPDGRQQVLTGLPANRAITLVQDSAHAAPAPTRARATPVLEDITATVGATATHEEDGFLDWNREPLMTHLLSTEGPALAVGDVNGDGLDDVFLGGAKWHAGQLLLQQANGGFRASPQRAFQADSLAEDVDAVLFDADGDGDKDLYVVSGGSEFWGESDALRDRLYLNDGKGAFTRDVGALPAIFGNGGCVAAADFDRDGDIDLFVGARSVPRAYGTTPKSHLLRNDGHGHFADVTDQIAPGLGGVGMVTAATWVDTDGDGHEDLVVVGEWMPVTVFRQAQGSFENATPRAGFAGTEGWWTSVVAADITGDGKPELVLGNLGRNSYVRASAKQPAQLLVADFGNTGAIKQLLTFFNGGVSYPLAGRDELVKLIPSLRQRFPNYSDFGASRVEDIFSSAERSTALVRSAHTFESAVAVNRGDGTFALRALPVEAQFAPIYASLVRDFDGDGTVDLLVGGNFFGVAPVIGRYDASFGLLMKGHGDGTFTAVPPDQSGVAIAGQVRDFKMVARAHGEHLVAVARNNDRLLFLRSPR